MRLDGKVAIVAGAGWGGIGAATAFRFAQAGAGVVINSHKRVEKLEQTAEQIRAIVDIQLGYLRKRLLERDMELTLDDAARDLLGDAGFDPVYGARPLKRAIQQQVENPLAQKILRGEFGPGDRVRTTVRDGQLAFVKG